MAPQVLRVTLTALVAAALAALGASPLLAQVGVIERGKPTTLRGEIVEISCYQKKGVAGGTGEAHAACAKECAAKGLPVGILTEGDGLFKIVGSLTDNNNVKLVPYLGQTVDLAGEQVVLSNQYDIRQNFEAKTVTPVRK
jgi:hypothetical protein